MYVLRRPAYEAVLSWLTALGELPSYEVLSSFERVRSLICIYYIPLPLEEREWMSEPGRYSRPRLLSPRRGALGVGRGLDWVLSQTRRQMWCMWKAPGLYVAVLTWLSALGELPSYEVLSSFERVRSLICIYYIPLPLEEREALRFPWLHLREAWLSSVRLVAKCDVCR